MYWGREYWEIFLIAVVVVIVFGVIQVSLGLADRENHRAGRWISDLLSRAIIGALCAGRDMGQILNRLGVVKRF